jgi:hypothetical protein
MRKIILHHLGFLSLVIPRIFCVIIIPMLRYVINTSHAYMLVTSGYHLDYNTQILYKRFYFNFYKKLHFLSSFTLPSWNIFICTLIYLYFMLLFRKGMYMKYTFKYLFKRFFYIFMFLYTLLRVTKNQIACIYYPYNDKDVNIEMYLRIILPLVKISLWLFAFGCVSFSRE